MNPSIEDIDIVLSELPSSRFLTASKLPEWLDVSEVRFITETAPTGSLRGNDGEQTRFYEVDGITDALLDLRISTSAAISKTAAVAA